MQIRKILYCLVWLILPVSFTHAQIIQTKSTTSLSGEYTFGGGLSGYAITGQSAVSSEISGGDFSGSVGFLSYQTLLAEENNAPIAIESDFGDYYYTDELIELDGYDPDDDEISFVIAKAPQFVDLMNEDSTDYLFSFEPKPGLAPDELYEDTIWFYVKETEGRLQSDTVMFTFEFETEDTEPVIEDLTLDVVDDADVYEIFWIDETVNASYDVALEYLDLTDRTNPVFKVILDENFTADQITKNGDTLSVKVTAKHTDHPYLLNASKVFLETYVETENGFGDYDVFILENDNSGANSRRVSADGNYLAVGGKHSVAENKSVKVKLTAIEFGEHSLSDATVEIITAPKSGTIGQPEVTKTQSNLKAWDALYTSTGETGAKDSLQFRVYNTSRQAYDTAWAKITIVNVNDKPVLAKIQDQVLDEDVEFVYDLVVTDPDNEVEIIASSSDATNFTVSVGADKKLKIKPGQDYIGKSVITVQVKEKGTNPILSTSQSFNISVKPINDAPVVAVIANQSTDEDVSLALQVSVTDVDTKGVLFAFKAVSDNPSILKTRMEGSKLIIEPVKDANGKANITLTADDRTGGEQGVSAPITFEVTINPINDAPVVVKEIEQQNLSKGFPSYVLDLSANFQDAETAATALSYSASGNDKVSLTFADGKATVVVDENFIGTEEVTITASDGSLSAMSKAVFVVKDQDANLKVLSIPSDVAVDEDFSNHEVDIASVFTDEANASGEFTYSVSGINFLQATVDQSSKKITFNAPNNYFGEEEVLLVATKNGSSVFTKFKFKVNAVNDAPVLTDIKNQIIQEDGKLENLLLEASDVDNTSLTATISSNNLALIDAGNLSITNDNGVFKIAATPNANANGSAVVTVTVSDGTIDVSKTFELKVQAVNDNPTFTANAISVADEDAAYSFDLATIVGDIDDNAFTYSVTNLPDWLKLNGSKLEGTPTNEQVGTTVIDVKVNDASKGEVQQKFDLVVNNTNDAPVVAVQMQQQTAFQANETKILISKSLFSDPDVGDELTISASALPSWLKFDGSALVGTPQYGDVDTSFVITATDKAGLSISQTVVLKVVLNFYDVTVTASGVAVCKGSEAIIKPSGAEKYNFYDEAGTLLKEKVDSYSLTPDANTTINVEGVDSQGLITKTKVAVTVTVNTASDVTISEENSLLSATVIEGAKYQWQLEGVNIEGATANTYQPSKSGKYTVVVTNASGCVSTSVALAYTHITSITKAGFGYEVYPVPANKVLSVNYPGNEVVNITITTLDGKEVRNFKADPMGRSTVDVNELPIGVYLLMFNGEGTIKSLKFVKK